MIPSTAAVGRGRLPRWGGGRSSRVPGIAFRPFAAARSPGARSLLAVGLLVLLPCLAVPAAADDKKPTHLELSRLDLVSKR